MHGWLDGYIARLEEFPRGSGPIGSNWQDTLGDPRRIADWTDYRVLAQGNHILLEINGRKVSELVDRDKDHAAAEDTMKHAVTRLQLRGRGRRFVAAGREHGDQAVLSGYSHRSRITHSPQRGLRATHT